MSLRLGQKIGRATIIEFLEEPNTGLALIQEGDHVFDVPCWLLEEHARIAKAVDALDTFDRHEYRVIKPVQWDFVRAILRGETGKDIVVRSWRYCDLCRRESDEGDSA